MLLHNRNKVNYVWSAGDPSRNLLVLLPCPVIKVNGNLTTTHHKQNDKRCRLSRNEGMDHPSEKTGDCRGLRLGSRGR